MPKLELDSVYEISASHDPRWMWLEFSSRLSASAADVIINESSRPLSAWGPSDWEGRVPFKLMREGEKPDVIGTDSLVPVYSGALVNFLLKNGFSGFIARPTVIYDRRDKLVIDEESYWVRVLPGCDSPDPRRGQMLWADHYGDDPSLRLSAQQMASAFGLYIPADSWTGNDIFRSPQGSDVFVTQRVVDALRGAGFTNCVIVPILEIGKEHALEKARWERQKAEEPRK